MPRHHRVFISHSAHRQEEPETQDFLDSLVAKLIEQGDFDVLLDQRNLQAGDDWLQRLYAWIGLSDAAIIVLSPRAVTREASTWVPRESNLLMWRKSLDPDFVVVPILVGGLKPKDIARNLFIADIRLAELQVGHDLSDDKKIQATIDSLLAKLPSRHREPVLDPIRIFVEDCLQRFAPKASVTATLDTHYGAVAWRPYQEPHQNLSIHLVKHSIGSEVDNAIRDVAQGSQTEYRLGIKLFQALFPMRLPAEPACALFSLCQEQMGRGAVIVNCHDSWVIRALLRLATGKLEDDLLKTWRIVELSDGWGDNDEEEVTRFLSEELAEAVLGTGGWGLICDDADPIKILNDNLLDFRRESGAPVLVCARFSTRWVELAALLSMRFPTVVFVLWTGPNMPDERELTSGGCLALQPPLPCGEDRRWQLGYRRRLQLLGSAA